MAKTTITYQRGNKDVRAYYSFGVAKVPAAAVSRLLSSLDGITGDLRISRVFYQGLDNYPEALNELERANISPVQALDLIKSVKPAAGNPDTKPRIEKEANGLARLAASKYSAEGKTPAELVDAMLKRLQLPEVRTEAVKILEALERNGRNSLGRIRLRPASPSRASHKVQLANLAKARAAKSKKSK